MLRTLLAVIAALQVGATPTQSPITGQVLDPEGKPVAAAVVTATTACDGDRATLSTEAVSAADGRFSVVPPQSHCPKIQLQVAKEEDLWLETGSWLDLYDVNGSAPILDLIAGSPLPLILHFGHRGAGLTVHVTEKATNGEVPARVAIKRCGVGPAAGWEMHTDTVNDGGDIASQVLPAGSYCVALMDVDTKPNRLYSTVLNCVPITLESGVRENHVIQFSRKQMRSSWKWAPVECPPETPTP